MKNSKYPNIKGLNYSDFVEQIDYLKDNYNILSMNDFINKDFNNNKKNCVLTFDDGYVDHFEFVFPTLLEKKIKGSFFTPVDTINESRMLDVNLIHLILAAGDEDKILDRLIFHYRNMDLEISLENYIESINKKSRYDTETTIVIKRLLQKFLPFEIRTKICRYLLEDFLEESEMDLAKSFYLSKQNIKEMISEGMHFGSHGKSHLWFSSLEKSKQEEEINLSIEFITSLYENEFDLTMCFPFGDYNKDTLDLLEKYNFRAAFTTKPKTYDSQTDCLLEIPRWDTNDFHPISK